MNISINEKSDRGPARFTRYQLVITACRKKDSKCVQLSAIQFLLRGQIVVPLEISNPGGKSPGGAWHTFKHGADEGPWNLLTTSVMGNVQRKWLDYAFRQNGQSVLEITFASPQEVDQYVLVTANDCPDRDPTAWCLSGEESRFNWVKLDAQDAAAVPLQRFAPFPCWLQTRGTAAAKAAVLPGLQEASLQVGFFLRPVFATHARKILHVQVPMVQAVGGAAAVDVAEASFAAPHGIQQVSVASGGPAGAAATNTLTHPPVFISLRYAEATAEAVQLRDALLEKGVVAYINDSAPGDNMFKEIATAVRHCKLAVIMGTRTYGQETASINSTAQELQAILSLKKPYFLVRMCAAFEVDTAAFAFTAGTVHVEWTPGMPMPANLVQKVLQKLATIEDDFRALTLARDVDDAAALVTAA